ncbi:hypothetical protein MCEKH45_00703 [Methylophilaceae bacterium]
MTTNIIELKSYIPSCIQPDPDVISYEIADLNTVYLTWSENGLYRIRKDMDKNTSIEHQAFIASGLMHNMLDGVLLPMINKINSRADIKSIIRNLESENEYLSEYDCTVATVPYNLVQGIGYRFKPAIELLTLFTGNQAIKCEYEAWLIKFLALAKEIQNAHLALGRKFTRTNNVSNMMLPLINSICDELIKIIAIASQNQKIAPIFSDLESRINRTID